MSTSQPSQPMMESARWAYRFILGCDPESEDAVAHWASLGDGRALLARFVQSPEGVACREAGFPAQGEWVEMPLGIEVIQAAHLLRFNAWPFVREATAELAAHEDLAAYRESFLNTPEVLALMDIAKQPAPIAAAPQNHDPADPAPDRLARVIRAAFPEGGAGRVLVDAGAHIGLTSLGMAAAAPHHAALLCFEPDQRSIALLRHNLAAHGLERARVLEVALAERDGTARLRQDASDAATSSLIEPYGRAQEAGATMVEVPVRRLDGMLAELGVERLDFLKINVGGVETPVMLGAAEAITRDRPVVFAQFNLWAQMTIGGRNPMEVLEEWHGAFPHMVIFNDHGHPQPILDRDGLLWALHMVVTQHGCVDDLVLCADLDWLERYQTA